MLLQNMQGTKIMELLLILAIILIGGKSGTQTILNEVVPVLESMGGKDLSANLKQAVKSAEEISQMLSAVREFTGKEQKTEDKDGVSAHMNASKGKADEAPANSFSLAPISNIAPREITYSLSEYFA